MDTFFFWTVGLHSTSRCGYGYLLFFNRWIPQHEWLWIWIPYFFPYPLKRSLVYKKHGMKWRGMTQNKTSKHFFFIQVVDKTLEEFPGLLFHRYVPCPGCMERRPVEHDSWKGLPLVVSGNPARPFSFSFFHFHFLFLSPFFVLFCCCSCSSFYYFSCFSL